MFKIFSTHKNIFLFIWFFVFIMLFFGGLNFNKILHFLLATDNNTQTINFYASDCLKDESTNYGLGWWNAEKALLAPDIGPNGNFLEFSDKNSAFYSGANFSLICKKFKYLKTDLFEKEVESLSEKDKEDIDFQNNVSTTSDFAEKQIIVATSSKKQATNTQEIFTAKDDEALQAASSSLDIATSAIDKVEEFFTKIDSSESNDVIILDAKEEKGDEEIKVLDNYEEKIDKVSIEQENSQLEIQEDQTEIKKNNEEISWLEKISNIVNAQEYVSEKINSPEDLGVFKNAIINFSFAFNRVVNSNESNVEKINSGAKEEENDKQIDIASSSNDIFKDIASNTDDIINQASEKNIEVIETDNEKTVEIKQIKETSFLKKFLNYAKAQDGKAAIAIWYSLDSNNDSATTTIASSSSFGEKLWQKLDVIDFDNISNKLNGGYFKYEADFIKDWQDIENLEIKFEGLIDSKAVVAGYLDSVWVEARYESETELDKLEKRKRWEEALEFLSNNLTLKADEDGEFKFRYIKNEKRIWDTLGEIIGFDNFWEEVDLNVKLVDSLGGDTNIPLTVIFEEDGEFTVKIPHMTRQIRSGKYFLVFYIEDNSGEEPEILNLKQEFSWGVLAINTNKSIYSSGETAYLQMAVLDDNGHTICDADVELNITDPSGNIVNLRSNIGTIISNQECGPNNVIDSPDYYAYYEVSDPGIYKMEFIATTKNGIRNIVDQFEVKDNLQFEIERIGPTRIYPKANYEMNILVKADSGFFGDIVEYLPLNFEIVSYEIMKNNKIASGTDLIDFTVAKKENEMSLTWNNVNMLEGDEILIKYIFDAPNVSPEFYLLGPLELIDNSNIKMREVRQWQIASDASYSITDLGPSSYTIGSSPDISGTAATYTTFGTVGDLDDDNAVYGGLDMQDLGVQNDPQEVWTDFTYDLSSYNISGEDITSLTFEAELYMIGNTGRAPTNDPVEWRRLDDARVQIYNFASSSWENIGSPFIASTTWTSLDNTDAVTWDNTGENHNGIGGVSEIPLTRTKSSNWSDNYMNSSDEIKIRVNNKGYIEGTAYDVAHVYDYAWIDFDYNVKPTGIFNFAKQKNDGSGIVDISIEVDHGQDASTTAKIEYVKGSSCDFSSPLDPSLDETDVNITADYGDPDIDNDSAYQVGTSSAKIITSSGSNTVNFDWNTKSDITMASGTYCLRLTVNDGEDDQEISATTTLTIDHVDPTAPGDLTMNYRDSAKVILNFGATSTEDNFLEYKIFYKVYDGTDPKESDSEHSSSTDANLGDILFNGAATTTISGLSAGNTYSFAIWVYDEFGQVASSSRVDILANNAPTGTFNSASQKVDGSGIVDISIEVDDDDSNNCKAKLEYVLDADCDFTSASSATIDTNSVSADWGSPVIDNNQAYQIGSSTGWISTPNPNTVTFDWQGVSDQPNANAVYCIRLTVNDSYEDQIALATTTLILDNINPSAFDGLSQGEVSTSSVRLIFGAAISSDTNEPVSNAYKIYYKKGTSGVNDFDTEYDDAVLDNYDYGGATSTIVSGLDSNTWYVFNIWAYDTYGNKATATEIAIKTNSTLSNDSLTFTNPQLDNVAIADNLTEWNFRAVVSETNGWQAIGSTTLRLADKYDLVSPYKDLEFYWDQTANQFYEIGNDSADAVEISDNSTANCSGQTCTLDFKLKISKSFASSSVDYAATIYSTNDVGVAEENSYDNIFQVKKIYIEQIHYRWRYDDGGE